MDVRLWRRSATLTRDVAASTFGHHHVDRLFLEIDADGDVGYGEVTPLAATITPDPSINDVVDHLTSVAIPRLLAVWRRERALPEWTRVHLWAGGTSSSAWSSALMEMALLDLTLVRAATSLDEYWGVEQTSVARMATTSLIDPDPQWRPAPDTARVRAKVRAGVDPANALDLAAQWERPVLLDFNGAAGDAPTVHAWVAAAVGRVELVAVEQPFGATDLAEHTLLAQDLDVAVSLDESVTSTTAVRLIARHGAAQLICVKPPRVGGLAVARHALTEADALGLRAYVGGFFESPLARRVHRSVAAGARVEASDVAPVGAVGDEGDRDRATGLGTVPELSAATLLSSWEIR